MADTTQDTDTQNGSASSETAQPGLRQIVMNAQYIKDLSFEHPNAPQTLLSPGVQPNVEIGVNVMADKIDDDNYEVVLKLTASAVSEKKTLFLIELSYAGIVSAADVDPQDVNALVMIQGPQLLFPFARAIISNITREGGFMPLNISPIDFVAVYRHNMQTQQLAAQQAASGETTQ